VTHCDKKETLSRLYSILKNGTRGLSLYVGALKCSVSFKTNVTTAVDDYVAILNEFLIKN